MRKPKVGDIVRYKSNGTAPGLRGTIAIVTKVEQGSVNVAVLFRGSDFNAMTENWEKSGAFFNLSNVEILSSD